MWNALLAVLAALAEWLTLAGMHCWQIAAGSVVVKLSTVIRETLIRLKRDTTASPGS
jgi:hypothetical protein